MTSPTEHSGDGVPAPVRVVEITREAVELFKILKFEGMVASGGQAKVVVASGEVLVNGKVEVQKRKKIVDGDTVEFNDEKILIRFIALPAETVPPEALELGSANDDSQLPE